MRVLRAAFARVVGIFTRDRIDDELRDELAAHLEMETAENIRRGMEPGAARRQAMLASGGLTLAAEAVRDQRGVPWLESIAADLKYAVRSLRRSVAFTTVVIVTLALGIGANTAIFSVVRGVLFKRLPHRDADGLVYLRHSTDLPGGESVSFSVPEVRDLRTGAPSLGGIAEFSPWTVTLRSDEGAERLEVGLVTGNYLDVMGLSPFLGRLTDRSNDGPGVAPVMVLTHAYWLKRFGGDSSIVGKQLRLDNRSVTVIGVLEPAPLFPGRVNALLNMVNSDHHISSFMVEGRTHRMTEVVARIAPGASIDQVRSEVAAITARIKKEFPEAYDAGSNHRVAVIPFHDVLGERARFTVWMLMAAAAFVMIISVANVANLSLMRGVRREHELVVRAALGAGVARLRRLLLAENLLLAFAGATFGVLFAVGGVRLLTSFAERYSPRANEIRLDGVVLAFTVGLSVFVALGLSFLASVPREGRFGSWILAGAHRMSGGLGKQRLQRTLVVVQVAVSVVLLAGAGLLTRTMMRLADVNTGLRTEEVLTMQVPLLSTSELLSNPAADVTAKERYNQMRDEIAALPGVLDAGLGSPTPLRSSDVQFDVKVEGRSLRVGPPVPRAEFRTADPNYFRSAGIPLLRGRGFASTDQRGGARVVVINQALAEQSFANDDPIGKRIAWTGEVLRFTPISSEWRTVVGVVGNTRDGGLDANARPVMFAPFAQELSMGGGLVVRADSNVAALLPAVTRIVRRIAPAAPIVSVATIAQIKDQSVAPRRLNAALISSFGGLALIIATVGIAGVLAFSVSVRTGEIGIRMSLGADRGQVQRMILREGGELVVLGLALGISGAFFAGRVMSGLLFGIGPHDPATLTGVAVMMLAIGVVACWIPAMRAARIDPATAMRS